MTQAKPVEISLSGRLDEKQAAELDRHMLNVDLATNRLIVIDMAGVTSVSSIGIGKLISINKAAMLAGAKVRLVRVPEQIRTMFRAVKLDKVLEITPA